MARLIQKSGYIKNGKVSGYMEYVATRDGVEIIQSTEPVTKKQEQFIKRLLKDFPDAKELFEYSDYLQVPNRGTASAFIATTLDTHLHEVESESGYMSYIAQRPRAEKQESAAIAEAMRIRTDDFRWYAAYHDEGHHPHVHMMVWSTELEKGYLTREGIAAMRSKMTNAIFHEEMKELYIKKDAAYKESVQTAKESLLMYIRMLESSESTDPIIEQKLRYLSQTLEQVDGKHVYGYLPKEVKAQVDEIVDRLAQLLEVAACYEQWWKLKDEIASYYGRNTPPHQPLVQQKEFRTIKNMIIQQAETFRQPVPEQAPVKAEPNEQQVPPSPESAVAMPQPQAVTSQIKIEGGAVIQLLHHMSRVFRGNMPVIPPALRIDSKRRRRLQEKRMAMGHKRDDHEDEQLHHVNDNAMQ